MAKNVLSFVCQNCGAAHNRWQGKCESCGEWNTLVEEDTTGATAMPVSIRSRRKGRLFALETLTGKSQELPLACPPAWPNSIASPAAGLVRGSVLLVGGDPGIGKSTLLTQATSLLARAGHRAVYISGEEAVAQVRLRAERLGLADAPVQLAAETSVEDIVSTLSQGTVPRLIVINSIQTMWTDTVESAPGTVTQVRASAQALKFNSLKNPAPRSSWSAMSPKTARSRGHAWSSTWSMPYCRSRVKARSNSASCARSRTGLDRPTKSACSR